MSLQTWKEEFYLIDASQGDIMSELEATEASLLKWTGLLPENLAKHGVEMDVFGDVIGFDEHDTSKIVGKIWITGSTCHLCEMAYYKACINYSEYKCSHCPIFTITGESCNSEYVKYRKTRSGKEPGHDPRAMIELLTKTRDHLKQEQQEQTQTKKD